MAKKDAVTKVAVNPGLPYTEIEVDGQKYKMVFNYRALAVAEDALRQRGFEINLLGPMLSRTFSNTRVLFAASLYAYHPELDPEVTQEWVTHDNLLDILQAVNKAWTKAMPDADPPPPEA